jgi:hypothetical protein
MFKRLVTIGLMFVVTTCAQAATLKVDKNRTIYIRGPIKNLMSQASHLEKLSKTKEDVYIVINSPGGGVVAGMVFMNVMNMAKARGVKLNCLVSSVAASMAFSILNECDRRFGFEYSMLMWHPMRVGGVFAAFSADEMEYIIKIIRAWELPLIKKLRDNLNISKKLFYYHYGHETKFTVLQLLSISPWYMTIIDNVEGIDNVFGT